MGASYLMNTVALCSSHVSHNTGMYTQAYFGGAVLRLGLGVVVLGGVLGLRDVVVVGGERGTQAVALINAFTERTAARCNLERV